MSTISTLVEETRASTTFVETTRAATSFAARSSSDPRIYTSAGELIVALDGSFVLRLMSLFGNMIKGTSPFGEKTKGLSPFEAEG
jgi:hypothetical protein